MEGGYKIVRDTIGPHVGQWIVEDENGRIIEGPFDTRRDAKEYLATRENWRQFYAGSVAQTDRSR